jgi:hypothetical protein
MAGLKTRRCLIGHVAGNGVLLLAQGNEPRKPYDLLVAHASSPDEQAHGRHATPNDGMGRLARKSVPKGL